MSSPTQRLAAFAVDLSSDDIPAHVRRVATDGILDTVGVAIFGAGLPWSRMLIDYALRYGSGGTSTIFGTGHRVHAPYAALANGALSHAFELDNLRRPSAGVHPGGTLVPAAFAIGEELDASGRDVLTAVVAGIEVMSRIGVAAHNTAEQIGFHSPGLTGTLGATVVAGRLLELDATAMTNALGIAASLCSGILAFVKAGNGGMVKRLHMGRAAEGGVLAARLAQDGFTGPDVVLEGRFGFFDVFTRDPHMDKLTAGLGTEWETERLCTKRYSAHITAHNPVQALEDLQSAYSFSGADIAAIELATNEKVLSHHANAEPNDIATAQYSVPVCLAIAAYRDPNDPRSFLDDPHRDPAIRNLAARVTLRLNERIATSKNDTDTGLTVVLHDGRTLHTDRDDFKGTPSTPMSPAELDQKFAKLTAPALGEDRAAQLNRALRGLDELDHVGSIWAPLAVAP